MKNINSKQRSVLRSMAHHLNPVIIIGKNGITDSVIDAIDKVIEKNELIKIKFQEYKKEKKNISDQLVEKLDCHLIGIIGHNVIFFRRNIDNEKSKYKSI